MAVTVSDMTTSKAWYNRLFGARHVVYAIGGGMLFGLHVFPDGDGSVGFNPRRPGLDHVAFNCADRAGLRHWQDRLNELSIKHGVIVDTHYGSGLSFRDPDDIDFAPPAA